MNIIVFLSLLIETFSSFKQINHNKRKKSIRGLAYDTAVWTVIQGSCTILTTLLYLYPTIQTQYKLRNPIFPDIRYDLEVLFVQIILFILNVGWLLQCFLYKASRSEMQGISGVAKGILLGLLVGLLYLIHGQKSNIGSFVLLDIVDYLWLVGRVAGSIKLLPQLLLNSIECSVVGHVKYWLPLEVVSQVLLMFVKFPARKDWYNIPVNYPSWPQVTLYGFSLVVYFFEERIYSERREVLHPDIKYSVV